MRQFESIHDQARGRWKNMLPVLGVPAAYLTGKHGPCPVCGGKDRFRFDDKDGGGGYFCNGCGPGTGIDLVMRVRKIAFVTAAKRVAEHAGSAPVEVKKATSKLGRTSEFAAGAWSQASPLTGMDPASKYLAARGLKLAPFPKMLRYTTRARYQNDDKSASHHPAMIARFVSPDGAAMTTHTTFLDDMGHKADVPVQKKLAPCAVPQGGAVRLANSAETMGIAEGIETALSAMLLFDVPVWAALSTGPMTKWQPPPTARHVIVFADNDDNFAGQHAAYSLAHRLRGEGYRVEVRIPDLADTDWNDMLGANA